MAAFLAGRLPFLGIAASSRTPRSRRRCARARPRGAHRSGRRSASPRRGSRRSAGAVNIFIAIVGLSLLVLVHEAGHFFSARAVGMSPRRFYIGFPPALAKVKRKGIEYGIGAVPLGGYVKIPGMHRPAPSDLSTFFGPALEEAPQLVAPIDRIKRKLDEGDMEGARGQLPALAEALQHVDAQPDGAAQRREGAERARRRPRRRRVLAPEDVEEGARHLRRARGRTSSSRSSSSRRCSSSAAAGTASASRWRRTRRSCTTCARTILRRDRPASRRPDPEDQRPAGSGRVRGAGPDPAVEGRPGHARRPPTRATPSADASSGRSGRARSRVSRCRRRPGSR